MWTISIEDDQTNQTSVQLVGASYLIGRSDESSIRLTERNISRHHATLDIRGEELFFVDHQSYNGSYINGVRVAGEEPLNHADVLHLGDYRLTVSDQNIETSEQGFAIAQGSHDFQLATPTSHSAKDRLVILVGPSPGSEFILNSERVVVGRGEECDFQIPHASVSRVHAEIRKLAEGKYEVVDKASANGLRINGVELPQSILDNRDVIELGDVALKFIPQGQAFYADRSTGERIVALSGAPPSLQKESRKLSLSSALFAAALGAIAVVAAVGIMKIFEDEPQQSSEGLPIDYLEQAQGHLNSQELLLAHSAFSKIDSLDPLNKSAPFLQLKTSWAKAILLPSSQEANKADLNKILELVANDSDVPLALRQQAAFLLLKLKAKE